MIRGRLSAHAHSGWEGSTVVCYYCIIVYSHYYSPVNGYKSSRHHDDPVKWEKSLFILLKCAANSMLLLTLMRWTCIDFVHLFFIFSLKILLYRIHIIIKIIVCNHTKSTVDKNYTVCLIKKERTDVSSRPRKLSDSIKIARWRGPPDASPPQAFNSKKLIMTTSLSLGFDVYIP